MIYEKRTYTINPLKMADWLALYQSDALAVQTDHLGQLIGFFFTEIGVVNQVVHIWAYESLDDRLVRRARMAQDERWQTFSRNKSRTGRRGTPRVGADAPHRFFTSAVRSPT